tara:strand:- start:17 stop:223 length:207 start_codon:yes stop_codon:yes gene_type:complete
VLRASAHFGVYRINIEYVERIEILLTPSWKIYLERPCPYQSDPRPGHDQRVHDLDCSITHERERTSGK